jgi:hypothetical protein
MMKPLSIEAFQDRVETFPWAGEITEFHVHHTADPAASWKGAASVESIRNYHVKVRGYRDYAQHVTLGPDGSIWLGRDWNLAPASATGHNGYDNQKRPFMVECFGNYLHDKLDGPQLANLVLMIAAIQEKWGLSPEAIRFHKEMQATQCPGNLDKQDLVDQVRAARQKIPESHEPAGWWASIRTAVRLLMGQRT